MSKIDKLSEWLLSTVQGGTKGSFVAPKAPVAPATPVVQQRQQPQSSQRQAHRPPQRSFPRDGHNGKRKNHYKGPRTFVQRHSSNPAPTATGSIPTKLSQIKPQTLRVIPVGGLEEIGKNCTIAEYENDIIAIDMGFQFPDDNLFGVDYIIPDIQYLVERKNRIRGIVITHAHLDHIGALPYVLEDLGFPTVYGSKLTIGLIQKHLEEFKLLKKACLQVIDNAHTYQLGAFKVDFFHVNHSIPDAMGVRVKTPAGSFVHTGDFKFDFTPADGVEADIRKMTAIGDEGIDVLFSESTNSMHPGHTISERMIAESLDETIAGAQGRIVIACFASLIGRIQQIMDFAERHGRKVFLSGGSLEGNVKIAQELGYLKFNKDQIKSIRVVNDFPDSRVLILSTGGQGEPMAALSRMAIGAHAQVKIHAGDTVVVSSSPIPGNEKQVAFLVDSLFRFGATVVHHQIMDVHTSGHGNQEDLKLMMSLIRPKHLVPIHGSFSMRKAHGDLAPSVGILAENVHIIDDGKVVEIKGGELSLKKEDIKVRYVVVDGDLKGDLSSQVLKERGILAQNGLVGVVLRLKGGKMVGNSVIYTRGFVYPKDLPRITREIEKRVRTSVESVYAKGGARLKETDYEERVRGDVAGFIVQKFDRRPLVNITAIFV